MSGAAVRVLVRVRPFNAKEGEAARPVIRMTGTTTTILDPSCDFKKKDSFSFDDCFWSLPQGSDSLETARQEHVYACIGPQMVDSIWQGYNTCLFAYGQTGSGKTYTMMGDVACPVHKGIIPRLCTELFERINREQTEQPSVSFRVDAAYHEIYNEKVKDLLTRQTPVLRVRQHPVTGPFVQGLSKHTVNDVHCVYQLLKRGDQERSTASTSMNDRSSRSHAIFTLTVTRLEMVGEVVENTIQTKVRGSKVNLVDLAGSERVLSSGVQGERFEEARSINLSLTTLGRVIDCLVERGEKHKPALPPYRESALTWLLSDSLGGNSKTFMIATISPSTLHYHETLSTLRYSAKARCIINLATVNKEEESGKIATELKTKIHSLQSKIRKMEKDESKMVEALEERCILAESEVESLRTRLAAAEAKPGGRSKSHEDEKTAKLLKEERAKCRRLEKQVRRLEQQVELEQYNFEQESKELANQISNEQSSVRLLHAELDSKEDEVRRVFEEYDRIVSERDQLFEQLQRTRAERKTESEHRGAEREKSHRINVLRKIAREQEEAKEKSEDAAKALLSENRALGDALADAAAEQKKHAAAAADAARRAEKCRTDASCSQAHLLAGVARALAPLRALCGEPSQVGGHEQTQEAVLAGVHALTRHVARAHAAAVDAAAAARAENAGVLARFAAERVRISAGGSSPPVDPPSGGALPAPLADALRDCSKLCKASRKAKLADAATQADGGTETSGKTTDDSPNAAARNRDRRSEATQADGGTETSGKTDLPKHQKTDDSSNTAARNRDRRSEPHKAKLADAATQADGASGNPGKTDLPPRHQNPDGSSNASAARLLDKARAENEELLERFAAERARIAAGGSPPRGPPGGGALPAALADALRDCAELRKSSRGRRSEPSEGADADSPRQKHAQDTKPVPSAENPRGPKGCRRGTNDASVLVTHRDPAIRGPEDHISTLRTASPPPPPPGKADASTQAGEANGTGGVLASSPLPPHSPPSGGKRVSFSDDAVGRTRGPGKKLRPPAFAAAEPASPTPGYPQPGVDLRRDLLRAKRQLADAELALGHAGKAAEHATKQAHAKEKQAKDSDRQRDAAALRDRDKAATGLAAAAAELQRLRAGERERAERHEKERADWKAAAEEGKAHAKTVAEQEAAVCGLKKQLFLAVARAEQADIRGIKLREKETELDTVRRRLAKRDADAASKAAEIQALQQSAASLEADRRAVVEAAAAGEARVRELAAEAEAARREAAEKAAELQGLQQSVRQDAGRQAALESDLSAARNAADSAECRAKSLGAELLAAREDASRSETRANELDCDLRAAQTAADSADCRARSLEADLSAAREDASRSEIRASGLESDLSAARDAADSAEARADSLEADLLAAREDAKRSEIRATSLEADLRTLRATAEARSRALKALQTELLEKQAEVSAAQAEAQAARKGAELLQAEGELGASRCQSLQSEIAKKQAEVSRLEAALTASCEEQEAKCRCLQSEILEKQAEVSRMEATVTARDASLSAATAACEEHAAKCRCLQSEIFERQTEVSRLEAVVSARDAALSTATASCEEHAAKCRCLQSEILERQMEVSRFEAELSTRDAVLSTACASSEEHAAKCQALEAEVSETRTEISRLEAAAAASQVQLEAALQEVEHLRAKSKADAASCRTLQTEILERHTEIVDLKAAAAVRDEALTASAASCEDQAAQHQALQAEISERRAEVTRLETAVSERDAALSAAAAACEDHAAKCKCLQTEIFEKQAEVSRMEAVVSARDASLGAATASCEEHAAKCRCLQSEILERQTEVSRLEAVVSARDAALSTATASCDEHAAKCRCLQSEILERQLEVSRLEAELTARDAALCTAAASGEEHAATCQSLQAAVAHLEAALSDRDAQLAAAEEAAASLGARHELSRKTAESRSQSLQAELTAKLAAVSALEAVVEDKDAGLARLEKDLAASSAAAAAALDRHAREASDQAVTSRALQTELFEKQRELAAARAACSSTQADLQAASSRVGELEEAVLRSAEREPVRAREVEELRAERALLEDAGEALKAELLEKQRELAAARASCSSMQADLQAASSRVGELEEAVLRSAEREPVRAREVEELRAERALLEDAGEALKADLRATSRREAKLHSEARVREHDFLIEKDAAADHLEELKMELRATRRREAKLHSEARVREHDFIVEQDATADHLDDLKTELRATRRREAKLHSATRAAAADAAEAGEWHTEALQQELASVVARLDASEEKSSAAGKLARGQLAEAESRLEDAKAEARAQRRLREKRGAAAACLEHDLHEARLHAAAAAVAACEEGEEQSRQLDAVTHQLEDAKAEARALQRTARKRAAAADEQQARLSEAFSRERAAAASLRAALSATEADLQHTADRLRSSAAEQTRLEQQIRDFDSLQRENAVLTESRDANTKLVGELTAQVSGWKAWWRGKEEELREAKGREEAREEMLGELKRAVEGREEDLKGLRRELDEKRKACDRASHSVLNLRKTFASEVYRERQLAKEQISALESQVRIWRDRTDILQAEAGGGPRAEPTGFLSSTETALDTSALPCDSSTASDALQPPPSPRLDADGPANPSPSRRASVASVASEPSAIDVPRAVPVVKKPVADSDEIIDLNRRLRDKVQQQTEVIEQLQHELLATSGFRKLNELFEEQACEIRRLAETSDGVAEKAAHARSALCDSEQQFVALDSFKQRISFEIEEKFAHLNKVKEDTARLLHDAVSRDDTATHGSSPRRI
ncbi:Kinesin-like protein Klp98A [Diplonema papillatum]|nr:Kinesin-like protein Klp98A [Diplonema papillatum]